MWNINASKDKSSYYLKKFLPLPFYITMFKFSTIPLVVFIAWANPYMCIDVCPYLYQPTDTCKSSFSKINGSTLYCSSSRCPFHLTTYPRDRCIVGRPYSSFLFTLYYISSCSWSTFYLTVFLLIQVVSLIITDSALTAPWAYILSYFC